MNRRQFFKAAPAMLVSPMIPKPEVPKPLAGEIAVFNGKEYITVVKYSENYKNPEAEFHPL